MILLPMLVNVCDDEQQPQSWVMQPILSHSCFFSELNRPIDINEGHAMS